MKRLQERAMLVTLTMTSWSGRKQDRDATADVLQRNNAKAGVAKVMKNLIDRSWIKPIAELTTEAREQHYALTTPWDDKGRRLLPVSAYERYKTRLTKILGKRETAVASFAKNWDKARQQARKDLGTLFDEDEYPTAQEVQAQIKGDFSFEPLPDGGHFIAALSDAEQVKVRENIQQNIKARVDGAVTSLYTRLGAAVTLVANRVRDAGQVEGDDKTRRLHASLLDTLREVAEVVPTLNFTDDPKLEKLAKAALKTIEGVQADVLRPKSKTFDREVRDRVSDGLDDLKQQFAGYFPGAQQQG